MTEPEATFSTCFAAPFLPLPPKRYAAMLQERLERHGVPVWLVNTGWTGGPFGVGKRMALGHTLPPTQGGARRGTCNASFSARPRVRLDVPTKCPGVPDEVLQPRRAWADPAAYDRGPPTSRPSSTRWPRISIGAPSVCGASRNRSGQRVRLVRPANLRLMNGISPTQRNVHENPPPSRVPARRTSTRQETRISHSRRARGAPWRCPAAAAGSPIGLPSLGTTDTPMRLFLTLTSFVVRCPLASTKISFTVPCRLARRAVCKPSSKVRTRWPSTSQMTTPC